MIERIMPHDSEAEIGVIGSMMSGGPETIDEMRELLTGEAFYVPAHRILFEGMLSLHSVGIPTDSFLRDYNGELDKMRPLAHLFMSARAVPAKKEPADWRELFRWLTANPEVVLPASFWKLGRDQQLEYEQNIEAFLAAKKEMVAA